MLFDLRSRGRRNTVRVIYSMLAILMLSGLVLFGVGAGNGIGGLLNAFTNNGSGGNATQVVDARLTAAEKAYKAHPTDPTVLSTLLEAQFRYAGEGTNFNSQQLTFTAGGLKAMRTITGSPGHPGTWSQLLAVTSTPSPLDANLAAKAYSAVYDYAGEASAWEVYANRQPDLLGFECLAAAAYAAGQTRKGDLAAAQAVKLAPPLQRLTVKNQLAVAKTSPTAATYANGC